MASTSGQARSDGDFYSTPTPVVLLLLMVLAVAVLAARLVADYCDAEVAVPAANEHSVPPPLEY